MFFTAARAALAALCFSIAFSASHAVAQTTQLIAEVDYSGNEFFSDYDLFVRTRVRANREFLGISGFRWWLWVYRLGESGKLGNRLGRALTASGEAPAVYDGNLIEADVDRLLASYRQEGFRSVEVSADTSLVGDGWIRVVYEIAEGPPTFIRRISYEGTHPLSDAQREAMLRASIFDHDMSTASDSSFVATGERYSEPALIEERQRILEFLHNSGYASATRDSVKAIIVPAQPDSFDVTLRIQTGASYRFGDVHFVVTGPEPEAEAEPRESVIATDGAGQIDATFSNESRLNARLLQRALRFSPGGQFDQSQVLATKRRLEATGVFAFTNVSPVEAVPAGGANGSDQPRLNYVLDLRTRPRHSFGSEWFMMQRGGALGGADAELGMGIGASYRNANLLGSGEAFNIRASASMAADSDFKLFTSTQGEVSFGIRYPYLIDPFRRVERITDFYNVGTRLSLSFLTARRDQLKLIVRGRGDARFRLEMQHAPTVWSYVDVLDISLSNPDTLAGFGADFLDPLLASIQDDPVQRAQIIEDYTQPQVNDAFRYTYRSARVNPLKRDQGYSSEGSVELGGTMSLALDRWVFSPDTLEGTLPVVGQRLVYRPYVRMLLDIRQYNRLSNSNVLAWKFIAGAAHPVSTNQVVPFGRRFFAGGAFSVRGWRLGELGPGAATIGDDAASSEATNILGGDIKLESSIELRHTLIQRALAAEWIIAPFVDAGNVWFGPRNPGLSPAEADGPTGKFRPGRLYREIGVGTGLGIRIAWEYLIIRFDLAVQVYDPARPDFGLFPDKLRHPLPHFGIGHTF